MNNVKKIVLSVHLNDRITLIIDKYNVTIHRLVGYTEKSGNPVYKDTYHGTMQKALESLLPLDVLSEAENEEMSFKEYYELVSKCKDDLVKDIKELLKGDPLPCQEIINKAKRLCLNCDGPDTMEDNEEDDDE